MTPGDVDAMPMTKVMSAIVDLRKRRVVAPVSTHIVPLQKLLTQP